MALFGRKKKEKEEEDYEEDGELEKEKKENAKLKKKLKDLNPEDKKKRREPTKPWGKKERFLVFLLILVTAGGSGFLALSAREYKLPGLPRLDVNKLGQFNIFSEETIVIEGDMNNLEPANKVKSEFVRLTEDLSGVYGLYVVRLEDGFSYGVNEFDDYTPASLNKLPAIVGMYMLAEDGKLNLNDKYTLKSSDKLPGSGSLSKKPVGTRLTYRELVEYMAKESDNTAFNISRRIIAGDNWEAWLSEFINSVGMDDSVLSGSNQRTTPQDVGVLLKELYMGNLVKSEEFRDETYEYLSDTIYESWLSKGIPMGVEFAHKYGREVHIVNDAGIVFADQPFVVVVMSKGVIETEADKIFEELSEAVYRVEGAKNDN